MALFRVEFLLLSNFFLGIFASYHWRVTENGRISSQLEASGFPLNRQDDLFALLGQEQRLRTVSKLYRQLMSLKDSIDLQWSRVEKGDVEKKLYSSDVDCLIGEIPLSQYNLNTEFLDYGQGTRPRLKRRYEVYEPDCTVYSKLDFSMRTFPHLETLSKRTNFNMSMNTDFSKNVFDFDVKAMLRHNTSDWTAYNIASLYWRKKGNGTNALECAKRALYFSPRRQRYIVLLNLGTLLQELERLDEATVVLRSAVDHDPTQDVSHMALGNVYATMGDYKRSLACYENVLTLNPGNIRALQLKHALLCQKKVESALKVLQRKLKKILDDLHTHNSLHEEWLRLQNEVSWERNSQVTEFFSMSQPLYLNIQMLLQNVENQARALSEAVSKKVPRKQRWGASSTDDEVHRTKEEESQEDEDEESDFDDSQQTAPKRVNQLLNFVKYRYKEEISLMELKRKVEEGFHFLHLKSQFVLDRSLWYHDIETCAEDSSSMKKLN